MDWIDGILEMITGWFGPPAPKPDGRLSLVVAPPVYAGTTSSKPVTEVATVTTTLLPTIVQLQKIMPHLPPDKAQLYLPHLLLALQEAKVDTHLRIAAFLAQVAHESYELHYMEEVWGPTTAQKDYEGRKDLGNVQPGDGYRYRGRGPFQVTGRSNYRRYGSELAVDLEGHPELASTPAVAFRTAAKYWIDHGLNVYADRKDFREITLKINGGLNGQASRVGYYRRGLEVFGESADGIVV